MKIRYFRFFTPLLFLWGSAHAAEPPAAEATEKPAEQVSAVEPIEPPFPADMEAVTPFPDAADTPEMRMRKSMVADAGVPERNRGDVPFPDRTNYTGNEGTKANAPAAQRQTNQRNSRQQEPLLTTSEALDELVAPISPEDISRILQKRDGLSAALAQPVINSVPRTSSQVIDLSDGSSMPVIRVAAGRPTYIVFQDITGAPWPLAETPVNSAGNARYFVRWFKGTPTVLVQPLITYGNGDLGVMLKDLPVPVSLVLANAEPMSAEKTHIYDSRVTLRIPKRGPLAPRHSITSIAKIALSDPELQSLLDGIPPADSVRLKTDNGRVSAWKRSNKLYIRTALESKTQFSKTLSSADGMHVYEMELSPFIALTDKNDTITVKVEL